MRREIMPIFLVIILLLPYGYFKAGEAVYDIVAKTNTDCWGNFDHNTPESFSHLRDETPLNESVYQENISSEIMDGMDEYFWPSYSSAMIEVPDEDLWLSAWYYDQNESMPWVIFVHGIRGCKSGGNILMPAGMLINAGFNVIVFDLRDHGQSSIEDDRVSAGQKEWRDVIAVHDWLIEEHNATVGRIGLFGNSMGAGTAAITFAQDDRIEAIWLDSGFSDMGKIIEEELEFQGLPTFLGGAGIFAGKIVTGEDLTRFSPLEAAETIGDRHMYVVHGESDVRVRVHHGQSMCDIATEEGTNSGENVECWIQDSRIRYDFGDELKSDEHVSLMLTNTLEYEEKLIDFFTNSFD